MNEWVPPRTTQSSKEVYVSTEGLPFGFQIVVVVSQRSALIFVIVAVSIKYGGWIWIAKEPRYTVRVFTIHGENNNNGGNSNQVACQPAVFARTRLFFPFFSSSSKRKGPFARS